MRKWLTKLSGLGKARKGQTTAEYAIIVALVAVSSIAIILIFGNQVRALFAGEATALAAGQPGTTPVQDMTGGAPAAINGSLKNF